MRATLRALSIAAVAALLSVGPALAAPAALTPSPLLVHAGDLVTVTGDACPSGQTVTQVLQQTLGPNFAKGVPPFVPLDLGSINLSDTAQGVSFQVTPDTPRRTLNFRVDCSDGSQSTNATPVTVQPPIGEVWWTYPVYGQFMVDAGGQFFLTARNWECQMGSAATATITNSGGTTVIGPLTTTVAADGVIEFDVTVPSTLPGGTYTGTISCNGGAVSGTTPITVVGDGSASTRRPSPGGVARWRLEIDATLAGPL
ncbi:MAG: hypothetical protein ABMA25_27390, partial [Ilumatobacteraceae bacterium]